LNFTRKIGDIDRIIREVLFWDEALLDLLFSVYYLNLILTGSFLNIRMKKSSEYRVPLNREDATYMEKSGTKGKELSSHACILLNCGLYEHRKKGRIMEINR